MELPKDFISEINNVEIDSEAFLNSLSLSSKTSIRRHRYKSNPSHYKALKQVDWCALGHYLLDRPKFNEEPSFLSGEYYVQEASSMFLHHILQQIPLFDETEQPLILDACAAPGGKSTILLDYLHGKGTLVANEVIRSRAKILSENIIKWGYSNSIVTNSDISRFSPDIQFDLILVDAPCSGEGLFRKDPKAIHQWSSAHVQHCSARQRRILDDVCPLLKPGGYLVYSTCTYNKQENEDQVNRLISQYSFSKQLIVCPKEWNIQTSDIGFRFFPHLIDGEGLYMAVLRKPLHGSKDLGKSYSSPKATINQNKYKILSNWISNSEIQHFQTFQNSIVLYTGKVDFELFKAQRIYSFGRPMGKLICSELRPHPHFAFSLDIAPSISNTELTKPDILAIANRKIISSVSETGWTLLTYRGNGLYWAKTVKDKYKVQYPKY